MKIYRLYTLYDKKVYCENGYYFRTSEEYYVGDKGLKTAKRDFILAREDETIDAVELNLCDIDFRGKIVPIDTIDIFMKES